MPAPALSSHNLVNGMALNSPLTLTFDTLLLESSITESSITLSYANASVVIPVNLSYAAGVGESTVTITPEYVLDASTGYRLDIHTSLLASDSTPVAATITVTFNTGTGLLEPADLVTTPTGTLWNAATGVQSATGFYLVTSIPEDKAYDIRVNPLTDTITTQIILEFSEPPEPTHWPAGASLWSDLIKLQIEVTPIDGRPTTPVSIPDFSSCAISGNTVTITMVAAEKTAYNMSWDENAELSSTELMTFLDNNVITLTIDGTAASSTGNTLGDDVVIEFTTELFPRYNRIKPVFRRYDMIASILDLDDREKDYLIYEESNWLADMLVANDSTFRYDVPNRKMQDYVRAKVLHSICHEAVGMQAMTGMSQDKQIGIFRVTKNFSGESKVLTKFLKNLEDDWRNALECLLPVTYFKGVVRGINSPYRRTMQPSGIFGRRAGGYRAKNYNPWGDTSDAIGQ